ncbi:MAG: tRNA preQ1(34) S-adenosylmethionine ribosyltransferase-isomerase QueA [Dehalococcoidia bacterium]
MDLSTFDYNLPNSLIAQNPVEPRDHSRLMIVNRENNRIEHKHFYDLPDHLDQGDVLLINETKVVGSRMIGEKENTGGKAEILLLKIIDQSNPSEWEALVKPSRRLPIGSVVIFPKHPGNHLTVLDSLELGKRKVKLSENFDLSSVAEIAFPPYIKHSSSSSDKYQTVFAAVPGSVAAPTAGLHFTDDLIDSIRKKGVIVQKINLQIGAGTFVPVTENDVSKHVMSTEKYSVPSAVTENINKAKALGKRVVCVGTTSVRSIESLALVSSNFDSLGNLKLNSVHDAETDLFITPGFPFKITDGLITNFHLPKSTLIMLVSAFAGLSFTKKIYEEAITNNYRFYSFGDAMMIT